MSIRIPGKCQSFDEVGGEEGLGLRAQEHRPAI
jgi:hypothetical protein